MMKGVRSLVAGAGCLLLAVLTWVALGALRANMIRAFGIIATNTAGTILLGAFLASGLAAIVWGLYQWVPSIIKSSSEGKLRKSALAYRAKTSGMKEVREQLLRLRRIRPRLAREIDKCLDQMDDMSSLFSRFGQLITNNDAESVRGGMIALKEIEGTLRTNFDWAINNIIAADDDDAPETSAFYDQSIERIERVVAANARALDKGNEFLLEIADNISQAGGDTILTDGWLAKIRVQNERSTMGTEERR